MGYDVRSVDELAAEARGYFESAVDGAVVPVWPNTFDVVAKAMAMLGQEHELRRSWLYDQLFVLSAAEGSLERHGYELGLVRAPGAPSVGAASFPAGAGVVVPAELRFVRPDGTSYRSVGAATAAAGTVTVQLEAESIGAAGDTAAGVAIRLASESVAPEGFTPTGAVAAGGLSGGADEEDLRAFRARVLARRRRPPACGNAADWERWTREALGPVAGVFVDSFSDDARAVWLQFTVTDQPNGVPSFAQVAVVQAYVADPVRRPVTARVFVSAPTVSAVNVVISDLSPDTADVRASIAAEIALAFAERVEPGKPSAVFRLKRSLLAGAISRIVGEGYNLVEPAGTLTFASGVLPTLGSISYV